MEKEDCEEVASSAAATSRWVCVFLIISFSLYRITFHLSLWQSPVWLLSGYDVFWLLQLPSPRNFIHLAVCQVCTHNCMCTQRMPEDSDTEYTVDVQYIHEDAHAEKPYTVGGSRAPAVWENISRVFIISTVCRRPRVIQDNCPRVIPRSLSEDMGCV